MSNIEEFEKYWYKPLYDSMKIDGNPDKDLFRYKDLGKQSALLSWIECCRLKDVIIKTLEAKNAELEKKLEIAKDTLERLDKITVLAESAKYIIKEALAAINEI